MTSHGTLRCREAVTVRTTDSADSGSVVNGEDERPLPVEGSFEMEKFRVTPARFHGRTEMDEWSMCWFQSRMNVMKSAPHFLNRSPSAKK